MRLPVMFHFHLYPGVNTCIALLVLIVSWFQHIFLGHLPRLSGTSTKYNVPPALVLRPQKTLENWRAQSACFARSLSGLSALLYELL